MALGIMAVESDMSGMAETEYTVEACATVVGSELLNRTNANRLAIFFM
jgi:hypothetical protein